MPEYLSPAVYVEEVSGGPRPIEGVSTSTAGMVGVTERGPENVPVLCTSIGDYRRVFGGDLPRGEFTDPTGRVHGHTYQAVKGFFENGGRRDFVVRVAARDAEPARRWLYDRGTPALPESLLLRAAPEGSGTAVNLPRVYALQTAPALALGASLRVGDGSRSEYHSIAALGAEVHVALNAPLARAHAGGSVVDEVNRTVDTTNYAAGTFALDADAGAGATSITVTALGAAADAAALLGLPGDALFEIGTLPRTEYRLATAAADLGGGLVRLTLAAPLALDHAAGGDVAALELPAPLSTQALATAVGAGQELVYLDTLGGGFPNGAGTKLVVLEPGTANAEVRRLGTLGEITLDLPAYADHAAGTRADLVTMADDDRILAAGGTRRQFVVDRVDGLVAGTAVSVDGNPPVIVDAIDAALGQVTTRTDALPAPPAGGEVLVPAAKALTAAASAGGLVIALDNRLGLAVDDVLRIGGGAAAEYVTIAAIMGARSVAPDAGAVVLTAALGRAHPAGTAVRRQTPPAIDAARQPLYLVTDTDRGESRVFAADAGGYAAGEIVAVAGPGRVSYHALSAVDLTVAAIEVEFDGSLEFSHRIGAPAVLRDPLIEVVALDRGGWGNRLRVAVRDPETPLVQARLTASSPINPLIELSNYTGVEAGTVLEYFDPATGAAVGTLGKVVSVDRAAGEVRLDAVPDPAVTGSAVPLSVRSREFEVLVFLLQQPDPAQPGRNDTVIDSEVFLCAMDPRHSRYVHTVIGTTWAAGADTDDDGRPLRAWDRRSEGESAYVRVRDVAAGNLAVTHATRLGPEPLEDILVTGVQRAARLAMAGGDDAVAVMNDAMYQGLDSNEPRLRTGLHALQNELTVSIVAVPGQVTTPVQQALINHCERDRYRFAILDGPPPERGDTLVDVQLMRQQFDTSYAALYHPWVTIPDPMPGNIASIRQVALPPSGPVAGIYARTDVERGVHKAPANAVVAGITGLTRYLNQREQDILNPLGINVTRDFRRNNRGIRVWGARCATSEAQLKYVSVRRLLIFLSASIERGLQYAVFEPNSEALWAQARRSISGFLTVVWRNGALEGTAPEQAFFVRCDRSTMTQDQIDNGQLIVEVGVAPVKPAEFVIVRIRQKTADAPQ
jgi:phage tail sheath protein FI